MKTITSANSEFLLAIGGIYPVAQRIEGYQADAAFAFDDVTTGEVVQGVDGKMSKGWIPHLTPQTITIMPDSPSFSIFNNWALAEDTAREKFSADATITLPSIGMKYVLSNGALISYKPMPDAKKTLQPMTYKITWESCTPSPI